MQKDTDARWTLKFAKGRPAANDKPQIDIAIPSFGYKSSIAICRTFGFKRAEARITLAHLAQIRSDHTVVGAGLIRDCSGDSASTER